MKLYHGSNVKVENPTILDNKRALDFSKRFYLTTDLKQAKRWARLTTDRRESGICSVSVYEYGTDNDLTILKFDTPNIDWLKFISKNRKMETIECDYDVIIGPVANDNTMPIINRYLSGIYNKN